MKKIVIFLFCILSTAWPVSCGFFTTTTTTTQSTESTTSTPISSSTTTTTSLTSTTTTTSPTTVSSSTDTQTTFSTFQQIDIYSVNDLHGTAYTSLDTVTRMGAFLHDVDQNNPNALILGTGDMFQGTALSNYYHGRPIVEALNYMGFDSFTLGNHEFDWGIDQIAAYADGNAENGEMDYPVLAANIVSTTTGEMLPWTQPYVIYEASGVRIGIIGVIGDVINSISASRVQGYEFLDVVSTVQQYAYELRTQEECDLVLVSLHEYDYSTDSAIAALSGNYHVDAVFNGHTHSEQTLLWDDETATGMPSVQIDSDDMVIAKITLVYDQTSESVIAVSSSLIAEGDLGSASSALNSLLSGYTQDPAYVSFISEVLVGSAVSLSKYSDVLHQWGSSVIRDYAGVDFGMVNGGGFRVNLASGSLTMGELVQLYPFDNNIKTCEMTGQQLTDFYQDVLDHGSDVVFDDGVSYDSNLGILYKDGVPVGLSTYYTVGAVDYIFDKDYYAFLQGRNIQTTELLMRDLLAEDLRATVGTFDPANGTSYQDPS